MLQAGQLVRIRFGQAELSHLGLIHAEKKSMLQDSFLSFSNLKIDTVESNFENFSSYALLPAT